MFAMDNEEAKDLSSSFARCLSELSALVHKTYDGVLGRMLQRLGLSIVPMQLGAPQRQAHTFFRRAVCGMSRVMP